MSTMALGGAKPAAKRTVRQSIRFHLMLGLGIVLVLLVGLGGWASTVQISGALIAPGQIVVESNVKRCSIRPAASSARCVLAMAT